MTKRRPSVVFFNRVYPPMRGASGRVLRDLARAFAEKGWQVTIVATGPKARREYDGSIRVVRVKASPKGRSSFSHFSLWLKMFWSGLNVPRHDLVVSMSDPHLLIVACRFVSFLKRSSHIHWCQDLYPDILPALGIHIPRGRVNLFRKLTRAAMKKCDKVVTIGRCMAKKLTHGGITPNKVAVIPNWPDYELLSAENYARMKNHPVRQVDRAKGARPFDQLFRDGEERKFRVLYSGNLGRAHPVETVLQAAIILNKDHPEIEFVFVGDGPNFEKLAHERARHGLDNIRLMPYQPATRLRELMESGDLHLITMKHESAGMLVPCKLYAALAVNRPCVLVGPEDCETAEIIRDFKAGSIVPQYKPEQLASEIKKYRLDSEAWFAAHKGAADAGQVFVPEQSYEAWLKRANDVINDNGKNKRRRA